MKIVSLWAEQNKHRFWVCIGDNTVYEWFENLHNAIIIQYTAFLLQRRSQIIQI